MFWKKQVSFELFESLQRYVLRLPHAEYVASLENKINKQDQKIKELYNLLYDLAKIQGYYLQVTPAEPESSQWKKESRNVRRN